MGRLRPSIQPNCHTTITKTKHTDDPDRSGRGLHAQTLAPDLETCVGDEHIDEQRHQVDDAEDGAFSQLFACAVGGAFGPQ